MLKIKQNTILILLVVIAFSTYAYGQQGFYIPKSGKIFFNGDSSTIFSDVNNKGSFGVGEKAFINFSGHTWENDPQSLITDESSGGSGVSGTGGWVRFLSDSFQQQLKGGYNAAIKSGPAFSKLQIENNLGVDLAESNVKVRKEITFSAGHVYLNDYIFTLGDGVPGKINGYDSSKYFVTANSPGKSLLLIENIRSSDGQITFPIGSREGSYTPAAIINHSDQGDDYYVNVFDSVRSNGTSGNNLSTEGVNKTWEIGKTNRPGLDEVEIVLQHLNDDEGSLFKLNRQRSYISQFNGSVWDTGIVQTSPEVGYLTSRSFMPNGGRSFMPNSGVNNRIFNNSISSPSYFTKFAGNGDTTIKTNLWFNAYRLDWGLVRAYWVTKPEVNVKYFVVQRRFSNEPGFKDVDTVSSLAINGISLVELNYSIVDSNSYTGISFYRVKTVNYYNTISYSNIVAVGGTSVASRNLLWPNPTPDRFSIALNPASNVKTIIIWNLSGQQILVENVNGRSIIEMGGLMPGSYFVGLLDDKGVILETKKLIVVGK